MHDGRFATLAEVIDFYDSGVKTGPDLDPRLRDPGGGVRRLGLTPRDAGALIAFLESLTDTAFLADSRFSSPFAPGC
jgi:cytochrome c peroxidase